MVVEGACLPDIAVGDPPVKSVMNPLSKAPNRLLRLDAIASTSQSLGGGIRAGWGVEETRHTVRRLPQ